MFKLTFKYFPSHNRLQIPLKYLYIIVFSSQIQLVQLLEGVGLGGGSRLATELMRATLTGQGQRDHAKGMDNSQLFTVYSLPPPPKPRYLSTYFTKQHSRQSRTLVGLQRNISASAILYTSE